MSMMISLGGSFIYMLIIRLKYVKVYISTSKVCVNNFAVAFHSLFWLGTNGCFYLLLKVRRA